MAPRASPAGRRCAAGRAGVRGQARAHSAPMPLPLRRNLHEHRPVKPLTSLRSRAACSGSWAYRPSARVIWATLQPILYQLSSSLCRLSRCLCMLSIMLDTRRANVCSCAVAQLHPSHLLSGAGGVLDHLKGAVSSAASSLTLSRLSATVRHITAISASVRLALTKIQASHRLPGLPNSQGNCAADGLALRCASLQPHATSVAAGRRQHRGSGGRAARRCRHCCAPLRHVRHPD